MHPYDFLQERNCNRLRQWRERYRLRGGTHLFPRDARPYPDLRANWQLERYLNIGFLRWGARRFIKSVKRVVNTATTRARQSIN